MEQEKFSETMDPQEMSENLQLLRGRTLSRLVDEIFSPFLIFSPTHLCPSFTEEERRLFQADETSISIRLIPLLALLQQDDQSESAGENRKR
jgi:hypothetical protein